MFKKFQNVKSDVLAKIYKGEITKEDAEYQEFVTEANKYVDNKGNDVSNEIPNAIYQSTKGEQNSRITAGKVVEKYKYEFEDITRELHDEMKNNDVTVKNVENLYELNKHLDNHSVYLYLKSFIDENRGGFTLGKFSTVDCKQCNSKVFIQLEEMYTTLMKEGSKTV